MQEMQRIGPMRHRVQIQSATETRDTDGGVIQMWTLTALRWGHLAPKSSTEPFSANQSMGIASHAITMRYFEGIDETYRLVIGGDIYSIVGQPVNRDGIKRFHECACKLVTGYESALRDDDNAILYDDDGMTLFEAA